MIILAEIDGWTKCYEVPEDALKQGVITIALYKPMNILADRAEPCPEDIGAIKVNLHYAGKRKGLPWFKA